MPTTTAELLLHPVRLRIVQAFLGQQQLTTADLRVVLTDVPPATLYRQVGALAAAGVLEVTTERKVRGAVERTFRLRAERAAVAEQELASMSVEEHRAAFTAFVAGLLADFDRYLDRERVDPLADLVSFRQVARWSTESETRELLAELRAVIAARTAVGPDGGRTRRLLSTVLLPDQG